MSSDSDRSPGTGDDSRPTDDPDPADDAPPVDGDVPADDPHPPDGQSPAGGRPPDADNRSPDASGRSPHAGSRPAGDRERDDADLPADPTLQAALERLRVERRILGDERSALRAFADRLLELAGPTSPSTIESHYRATVMATPHYWREYGDTYAESVTAEFGAIVAANCLAEEPLDPVTVTAIREAAERGCRRRDVVVDRIDGERHSIRRAAEELAAVRRALAETDADRGGAARLRLAMLRERCDDVARRRRTHLRDESLDDGVWLDLELPDDESACSDDAIGSDGTVGVASPEASNVAASDRDPVPRLQSLCYRDLETERPVFSAVDAVRDSIDQLRAEVLELRSDDG